VPAGGSFGTLEDVPEALYQPFPLPGAARAHVWHHVPETRRPRHFHTEPELNLITAGSGVFGVGDSTIAVAAGDLLWWSPGQDHVLLDASADFDLFVIGLTPELSARVLGQDNLPAHAGATRIQLEPAALLKLRALCAAPFGADPSAVERHVGDLWRDAHTLRLTTVDKHALTSRAIVSLMERPDLGRGDVALAARGHPTDVSRYFHKDVGLTLTEFRTRLRLLRFIHIADTRGMNLMSAALDAGFGSYSQCHRAFQETLGCSPSRFFGTDLRTRMEAAVISEWDLAGHGMLRRGPSRRGPLSRAT
jgi:AraC-like DNA-binding protein